MDTEKRKVLVFTINDYSNYGNRLQNYAMIRILQKLGFDAANAPQIYCKEDYSRPDDPMVFKFIKRLMPYRFWKKRMESVFHFQEGERLQNFLNFASLYDDVPAVVYVKKNCDIFSKIHGEDYSYFIIGSDQVWNPDFFPNLYIQMLGFVPDEKKIAIAPSIAIDNFKEWQEEEFRKYLPSFNKLSCREKKGADKIKELTNMECETIIDPTLMLSAGEWDRVIKKPRFHDDRNRYLLLYFLGSISEEYWRTICAVAQRYNLCIVNLGDKGTPYYQCGPSEFIWLIKNCALMLTDSFHGTVFSYIYDRPVKIFNRLDNMESMNSRLENLINTFHMDNVLVDINNHLDDIFYVNYEKKYWEIEKDKFMDYLIKVFNLECGGKYKEVI